MTVSINSPSGEGGGLKDRDGSPGHQVSINSPSGEGGGRHWSCSQRTFPQVSINSPSGEGGGKKLRVFQDGTEEKFPLILLQAKAGGKKMTLQELNKTVSINSPSGEGGGDDWIQPYMGRKFCFH